MSSDKTIMEISIGGHSVGARLMEEENPEVVQLVRAHLPFTTFALHTNVSGKGFVLPTTIVYTGAGHMVRRHPGAVYLFGPGQSIVFTYGDTNESAPVNKFAQVFDHDLPKLAFIGKAIYDDTLTAAQHKIVSATIRFSCDHEDTSSQDFSPIFATSLLSFDGGWKSASTIFLAEAKRMLAEEPDEVFKSFAGIVPSGMGTGGNVLPVWMHQWSCLMTDGPLTLHRFLNDAEIPGMTLTLMVDLTRNHLLMPFNHFEFLNDLGLTKFKAWGEMYSNALHNLGSLEEYKQLTAALLTLVNLYLRRVQSRFPFYMGKCFPRISEEDILRLTRILESSNYTA